MGSPAHAAGALFILVLLFPSRDPGGGGLLRASSSISPIPQAVDDTQSVSRSRQPDLDVTYIARTPRYRRYLPDYTLLPGDPWRIPRLCAGTEDDKRWPDVGEVVTYTAHVRNKGNRTVGRFAFEWLVNGDVVSSGVAGVLRPGREATLDYGTVWRAEPEAIEFRVDPDHAIQESVETQNSLTVGSHDLTISIWVEQGLYDIFNATRNLVGSRSFEDWIQAQFAQMNQRFRASTYPVAPEGIRDRVRIEKIVVTPELNGAFSLPHPPCVLGTTDPDEFVMDGRWFFTDGDPTNARGLAGEWQQYVDQFATSIDWGLIHELAHQLGVIDLYRMNLFNEPATNDRFAVQDLGGQVIDVARLPTHGFCQILFQYPGNMVGGDTSPHRDGTYFESHTAGGMNSHYNHRRGYFGEYLFDTPAETTLRLIDANGEPIAGASVQLFQKDAVTEVFDNAPEMEGVTDTRGAIVLLNRLPDTPVVTATGHMLRANPFGQIFHEGQNGTIFVRAVREGQELYGWLFVLDLNLAYWSGFTDRAEITIQLLPPANNACPAA